jgi:hypothetical protein
MLSSPSPFLQPEGRRMYSWLLLLVGDTVLLRVLGRYGW